MPGPAAAYSSVIASVLASTRPIPGSAEAVVAEVLARSTTTPPAAALVPFDPANPSAEARAALQKMQDDSSGTTTKARMEAYIDRFGFDRSENPPIRGPSIREPWKGVTIADLDAVLAVGKVSGVPPAHVLALWIAEGKFEHNNVFHGASLSTAVPVDALGNETGRQFRAFARSLLLFRLFGADPLISFGARAAADGDNQPRGPEAPHDAEFKKGLGTIRAAGIQGFSGSDKEIMDFFTAAGGALIVEHVKTGGPKDIVKTTMAKGSLASWLWLQVSLFESIRVKLEQGLATLYTGGGAVGLSGRPWVTYLFWNTNKEPKVITDYFGGAVHAEAAISRRFGSVGADPDHLGSDQLDRYYGRGTHGPKGAATEPPPSTAAWANAIMVKFLVETIEPWFQ